MAEAAHVNSLEQHVTAATKNSIYFEWIRCVSCFLHHQRIVDGTVKDFTRMYISWWCK
jgi:hypothetical protein